MDKIKIYVDDLRATPAGYVRTYSVSETIKLLKKCHEEGTIIEEISLDYDSGDYWFQGGDYHRVLTWLEEQKLQGIDMVESTAFELHSSDKNGRERMARILKRNGWTEIE